ncbi:MAG: AraC family transcriptional regulator [Cyclobacteriaceae bacterium]
MKNYSKYFAISEDDKSWGLHTMDCGRSVIKPGAIFPSPEHPESYKFVWDRGRILHEFQLVYLVEGTCIFESQSSGKIRIESGSIILIYPEIWHRYKPENGKLWHTYWVGFGGKLANEFIQKLELTRENPVKVVGYQKKIIQIFLDILETSQIEFTGYQQVYVGEVIKLIGLIHAIHRKSEFKQKNVDRIIQEAKLILMQKNLNISMEEVAAELNMGYSSFRKLFRDYTGISPGQYQMQHKINKAISLLNEGKSTIKEIAIELEFETPQYFARIFKKKTGKSPKEYSQQLMRRKGSK